MLVVVATQLTLGHAADELVLLQFADRAASFLAVLALGQGAVILTGGLDLSVPWTIGLCGILLAGMVKGSDAALIYALPMALLVGAADRLRQWRRHRAARRFADRHDARDERHPARRGAGLFQRHAGRLLLAAAAALHDRPRVSS